MGAETTHQYEAPPLVSTDEISVTPDTAYETTCLAGLKKSDATRDWQFGKSHFTQNEKWGLVLRVDFEIPGQNVRPFINRIVCWRSREDKKLNVEVIFGQDVPPLDQK